MATPIVFSISSDEDSGPDEMGGVEDFGRNEPKAVYDWLLELLEVAGDRADDSDEVVLVTAFNPTKKKPNSKSASSTIKVVDDDCVILDSDPDDSTGAVNDSGDGSDELLIVAEKGQIACRDYPHPRHLCATFPFMSTNHEKHCDMCHCYVCDTIAPCSFWGVGISIFDHCHATDKVEKWKMQRKKLLKENHNSVSATSGQANQSLPHDALRLTSNSPLGNRLPSFNTTADSLSIYRIFPLTTLPPNFSEDISASNVRNMQPVSHSHLGVKNGSSQVVRKSIRRDRGNEMSCLTSRFVKSDLMFKRTAALGATQANQIPSYRAKNPPPVALLQPAGDPYERPDSPASVISKPFSIPRSNSNQIAHKHLDQIENSSHIFQPVNPMQHVDQNNSFELGIQVRDSPDAAPNLNFHWLTENSLNNQRNSDDSSRLLLADSMHGHLPRDESDLNITENLINGSANVGLGNDNCLMENQTSLEDPSWLYDLNILSPPLTSINDAGMLGFYFETS